MLTLALEKLLILQDRDARRITLEAQMKAVPREVTAVEQKIAAEKAAIEAARAELKELEVKKKTLENDIGSAEERLAKYKNQQMQVKKNDEYQALGHEIDTTQAGIGAMEEKELQVMYAIDEAKKKFAAAEAVLKQNIAGHEGRIRNLRDKEKNTTAELESARAEVAAARSPIEEFALKVYDRVAGHKQPVCVPIQAGKCGGCHLKVSSEVESASRGKDPNVKLATCDQCGRIVYWAA
jgi:predicted  nucleic acid-binding Zn-ribbon protein